MSCKIRICVLCVVVLICQPLLAGNWPRFRGPNGAGIADDKDIPDQFDEKNGILWKVPMPGPGNSSPIVWENRLFVQATTKDGKARLLMCLDAGSGKTLWARSIPAGKAHTHEKNTLASSTPATDGQVVVTAFWDGKEIILAAYDLEGKKLWDRNLGSFTSQHGAGASPIIYKDKVFFVNDQDGTSTAMALNKKTGDILWQAPREAFRACYSAPFILTKPGAEPELIITSTKSIRSYQPDKGTVNWNWTWTFSGMPLRTTGSPIYSHDTIFACSGDGGGDRHMAAIGLEGSGARTQAKLLWENKKDFPYVPCLLSRGDKLYFVNDKGFAGCYTMKEGKQIWYKRLPEATFTSSPVMIDGKIMAASEEGDVYVLAAEPTFRLIAKNTLGERVRATPAVANNRLYIRGQHHLFCIGKNQ